MRRKPATKSGKGRHSVVNGIGIALVVAVLALLLYGFLTGTVKSPRARARAAQPVQAPAAKPWEYNASLNKYYNPLPGHQHWHDGMPPAPGEGGRPLEPPETPPAPAEP